MVFVCWTPNTTSILGICTDTGLKIYGGDATDAYAHSPAPNDTYLAIDDAYFEWYKDKFGEEIDRRYILPVKHCLQGHPESGKMWMHFIDNILIKEGKFRLKPVFFFQFRDRIDFCRHRTTR